MLTTHGKKRFSISIPGIGIVRYGTCEKETDDWRDIICENGEYYLIEFFIPKGLPLAEKGKYHLDPMTLVAHGYYDSEIEANGGFVPVKDFVWK